MKRFSTPLARFSLISFLLLLSTKVLAQCPLPENLSDNSIINGNGLNEVQLSWNNVAEALEYSVAFRVNGSQDPFTIKAASSNSLTVTALPPSTTYEWQVRSICSVDWSIVSDYSTSGTFTTAAGNSCEIPTNPTSNSTGSGSSINEVDLSWDAVAGAIHYNIAYRIQGSGNFSYQTVSTNAFTLSGLPASTDYEWKVRTVCTTDWSVVSGFTALETFSSGTGVECTAPVGVNISSSNSSQFTVAWTPVTSAIQYYIQFRIVGEQEWSNADDRFTFRTSDKTIVGIEADKNYEVRMLAICAVDGGGKWTSFSDYSNIVSFDTFDCSTPTSLSSVPGSATAILNWDVVPGALFYQIKFRETGTTPFLNDVTTSDGITSSVQIDNLDPNTSYDWIIRTRCDLSGSGNNSSYSTVQVFTTTDGTACTTPTGLNSVPSSNDATLNWNAVPGAIDYQIKFRLTGTTPFLNNVIVNSPATSTLISGLTADTGYDWIIRARCSVDGSNNSSYSSVQQFTTNPGASCDVPTNPAATPASTSATLSWDAMTSADQYRMKFRVQGSGGFNNTIIVTAPLSSVDINGLTANTTYEWLVRTECSFGNSAYTSVQTFTTLSSRPASVAESSEINISKSNSSAKSSSDNPVFHSGDESAVLIESDDLKNDPFFTSTAKIKVYPNPAYDFILFNITQDTSIKIYDSNGVLVESTSRGGAGEHRLDITDFNRGIYYFILEGRGFRQVERIVLN